MVAIWGGLNIIVLSLVSMMSLAGARIGLLTERFAIDEPVWMASAGGPASARSKPRFVAVQVSLSKRR